MNIELEQAKLEDAEAILTMQVKSFKPLLKKYQDYHASPANESIVRVVKRISNPKGAFYKILLDKKMVGAICIARHGEAIWISPMFIAPDYQGRGIAQKTLDMLEMMYDEFKIWELATLQEEVGNCYLYEKIGYVKTGIVKEINERATLVYYKKFIQ
ncbi:GNAT family N-acetyltransferase [Ornithinibacillus contaminans]|uniref:GNAT family N-acetyltransferase n=1 Tax=Ornithinibacillus contaminans TaxID=694055 RepID=UPI00064DFA47|nr:GNAT family N-acetyltransferase [Ornithinibacillus contaminans]